MAAVHPRSEDQSRITDRRRGSARVSVVIPTHDRAEAVLGAVDSVLSQTYSDLEAIVVDDGSTDATLERLRARYGADDRVRVISGEHRGPAAARNLGLDAASGSLIAFLDSDDRWKPWKLALQVECLDAVPEAGLIWTDLHTLGPDGEEHEDSSLRDVLSRAAGLDALFAQRREIGHGHGHGAGPPDPADPPDGTLYVGDVYAPMMLGNIVLPSAVVMRRTCVDQVGHFDETIRGAGEDFDFFLRAAATGPIAFLDVPSVLYQVGHADQLTDPHCSLDLARNYLRTMEWALLRDGRSDALDPDGVRRARAAGHAWTARCYLEAGDGRMARRHVRRALALDPHDAHTLAIAVVTLLPTGLRTAGIGAGRAVWARIRSRTRPA